MPPTETPLVPGNGPSSGSGPNASDLAAILHYIYGINFGKDGDHLQISPPFIIGDEEIGMIADALDGAVADAVSAL